jgi:hypothetical protein
MATIHKTPGTIKQVDYDSEYKSYSFVITSDEGGPDVTARNTRAQYSVGDRVEWRNSYGVIDIIRKI